MVGNIRATNVGLLSGLVDSITVGHNRTPDEPVTVDAADIGSYVHIETPEGTVDESRRNVAEMSEEEYWALKQRAYDAQWPQRVQRVVYRKVAKRRAKNKMARASRKRNRK